MKSVYLHLTERSTPSRQQQHIEGCEKMFEYARYRQRFENLNELLRNGCNVDAQRLIDKKTVLMLGIQSMGGNWYARQVKAFITEHTPNLEIKDADGRTALHFSAMKDSREITEILLEAGADINQKDNLGNAPIMYASAETTNLLERIAPKSNATYKPRQEIEGGLYVAEVDGKHIILFDHVSYDAVNFESAKNGAPKNEYTDWRLPTSEELVAVAKEYDMFPKGWYWTGEAFNHYMANSVLLPNGDQDVDGIDKKLYKLYVRSFK